MKTTNYKGYTVYSDGRIKKKDGSGYMRTYSSTKGYLLLELTVNGKRIRTSIHRLIWEAFNGPIPDGLTIDHIDNDKTNNRLDNLQLLTNAENNSKGHQIFTKSELEQIRYHREELRWTYKNIADKFGVHENTINKIQKKGYKYVYQAV